MHYNRLLKNAICIGIITSLFLTSGVGSVLSTTISSEQQLAGMSVLVDQQLPAVTQSAISVTGAAVTVTESAITVTEPKKKKKSKFANKGISTAKDYVCVRAKKSTDSKIVGKLHRGSMATITKRSGSWVKVTSGEVSGYVKKEYLAIGADAEKISDKYMIQKAKVQTETLMVREKKSTKAKILDMVGEADSLKVVKEGEEWTKVKVDGETGYVASDYIKVVDTYKKAVKVQEPKKIVKTIARSNTSVSVSRQRRSSLSNVSSRGSGIGSEIASYALQFVGNPYVYGGTSLTNGTDCSGFTQSVFRKFGISIPRTSGSQSGTGRSISPSEARAGDLIFYARNGRINHVALCIGGGRVVHASNPSTGIRTSNLYYRTPVAARRVL